MSFESRASLLEWDIILFNPSITYHLGTYEMYQGKPSLNDYRSVTLQEATQQMSIEELEDEIKKLTLRDRAVLAKWIVESTDELSESEIETLWAEEAEYRLDELERGLVIESQAEDVLRRARFSACPEIR